MGDERQQQQQQQQQHQERAAAEARTIKRADVAALLADKIGEDEAKRAVADAAREVGVGDPMTRAQGFAVLEQIAKQPGLVGISARFAKTRAHLRW